MKHCKLNNAVVNSQGEVTDVVLTNGTTSTLYERIKKEVKKKKLTSPDNLELYKEQNHISSTDSPLDISYAYYLNSLNLENFPLDSNNEPNVIISKIGFIPNIPYNYSATDATNTTNEIQDHVNSEFPYKVVNKISINPMFSFKEKDKVSISLGRVQDWFNKTKNLDLAILLEYIDISLKSGDSFEDIMPHNTETWREIYENISSMSLLENTREDISQSLSEGYTGWMPPNSETASALQRETTVKLMNLSKKVELEEESHTYTVEGTNQEFISTHDFIGSLTGPNDEKDFYKRAIEESEESAADSPAIQRGNQVDELLNEFLLTKKMSLDEAKDYLNKKFDTILIEDAALVKILNHFSKIFSDDNILYIPQVRMYSKKLGVAGTADVVAIHPNGDISVIDLKTSIYPFIRSYISKSGKKNSFRKRFLKDGKTKASKKDKYSAQVTVYAGILQEFGFSFNKKAPVLLAPIQLNVDENSSNIKDIKIEVNFLNMPIAAHISSTIFKNYSKIHGSSLTDIDFLRLLETVNKTINEVIVSLPDAEASSNLYDRWSEYFSEIYTFKELTVKIHKILRDLNGQDSWVGWLSIIETYMNDVKSGKIKDSTEILNRSAEYKKALEMYREVLTNFNGFLNTYNKTATSSDKIEVGSMLNRLRQSLDDTNGLITSFNDFIIDKDAEILGKYIIAKSEDKYSSIITAVQNIMNEINELNKSNKSNTFKKRKLKELESKLARRQVNLEGLYRVEKIAGKYKLVKEPNNETEDLKNLLRSGSKRDISWTELYLTPMMMSSNKILSAFANFFNDRLEMNRQNTIKLHRHLSKYFKSYEKFKNKESKNSVAKFNEGLYQQIDTATLDSDDIFSEIHFTTGFGEKTYSEARNQFIKELKAQINANEITEETAFKKLKGWERKNTVELIDKDITVQDPETGDEVIIYKSLKTRIAEKREKLNKIYGDQKITYKGKPLKKVDYEMKKWLDNHRVKTKKGYIYTFSNMRVPKNIYWETSLPKEAEIYRDKLLYTYFKAQELVELSQRNGTRVPSDFKSDYDRLRENGVKSYITDTISDIFKYNAARDEQEFGVENSNLIPMEYSAIIKPEDVSLDLFASVLKYSHAAQEYDTRRKSFALSRSLLDQLENNKPLKVNSQGKNVKAKLSKKILDKYKVSNSNRVAKMLEHFVESQIKLRKKSEDDMLPKNLQKFVGNLMGFQASTQIGLMKPLTNLANHLTAQVSVLTEQLAGRYLTKKTLIEAEKIMWEAEVQMIKDIGKVYPQTKHGLLNQLYDPVQGNWKTKTLHRSSQSALKRIQSGDSNFFLQNRGEWLAQYKTLIGFLLEAKVQNDEGKTKSMYNAIQVKDGQLVLEDGFYYIVNGKKRTDPFNRSLQRTMQGLNVQIHGLYNKQNPVVLERYSLGSAILMYRKFLPPNLRARFGSKTGYFDHAINDWQFGRYQAFASFIKLAALDLKNSRDLLDPSKSTLTQQEIYGVIRSTIEIMSIIIVGALFKLAKALDDDDDDDTWLYSAILYSLFRLQTELSAYIDPQALVRSFRTPVAAYSTVEKFLRIVNQIFKDPMERYKRDAGLAKEGNLKLKILFMKFFGINGATLHPDEALKMMQLSVK